MNTSLAIEKSAPATAALIAAGVFWFWGPQFFRPRDPVALLETITTVSGIASAFLITVKTLVIGNSSFKAIRGLKEARQFSNFVGYIRRANELCFALCAISAVPLFIDTASFNEGFIEIGKAAWFALVAAATASTWQVLRQFGLILSIQADEEQSTFR